MDALLPDRARRRPSRSVSERLGPRPDRLALWALVLAVVLIITAVATADASTLTAQCRESLVRWHPAAPFSRRRPPHRLAYAPIDCVPAPADAFGIHRCNRSPLTTLACGSATLDRAGSRPYTYRKS